MSQWFITSQKMKFLIACVLVSLLTSVISEENKKECKKKILLKPL